MSRDPENKWILIGPNGTIIRETDFDYDAQEWVEQGSFNSAFQRHTKTMYVHSVERN